MEKELEYKIFYLNDYDDIFYMQVGTNKRIKKVVENMSWWERLADYIKKWLG